jgi:hypothetical protein
MLVRFVLDMVTNAESWRDANSFIGALTYQRPLLATALVGGGSDCYD